jgi:hypothetical protein
MQKGGGLGKIESIRHRHEIAQVTQFHKVSGSLLGV